MSGPLPKYFVSNCVRDHSIIGVRKVLAITACLNNGKHGFGMDFAFVGRYSWLKCAYGVC